MRARRKSKRKLEKAGHVNATHRRARAPAIRPPPPPRAPPPASPGRPRTVGFGHGRLRHLGSGTASRPVTGCSSGRAGGTEGGVVLRVSVGTAWGRGPEEGGARGPHGNRRPPRGCGPAGLPAPRRRTASASRPPPAPRRARTRTRRRRRRKGGARPGPRRGRACARSPRRALGAGRPGRGAGGAGQGGGGWTRGSGRAGRGRRGAAGQGRVAGVGRGLRSVGLGVTERWGRRGLALG